MKRVSRELGGQGSAGFGANCGRYGTSQEMKTEKTKQILSDMDFGGRAKQYASEPYGHFKREVYRLFVAIISRLASGARVLDIGAGPGHLAAEFYKAHARSSVQFVLLDSSREMLRIATHRLAGRPVQAVVRSFNMDGWEEGLGTVDGIVSNNALFHLRPERLDGFYATCYALLMCDGFLLNHQSFGYSDGESPYGDAPFPQSMREVLASVLPASPPLTEADRTRLMREREEAAKKQAKAIAKARSAGLAVAEGQTGYQFLSVEHHLQSMRKAGFAAGCIWRKREFAVLCGRKITQQQGRR